MTEGADPLARADGRAPEDLRPVEILPGWLSAPPGSALIRQGRTWVLCTATLEERVPAWRRGQGRGWLTASYTMLPAATTERTERERRGAQGRTLEIERLIGRSLRGALDLDRLPEVTLHVDCDVLQADGGTRTVAVTGGWVALASGVRALSAAGRLSEAVLVRQVAAVSAGVVDGRALIDLDYAEDVRAETDMNVVMTDQGQFLEVQATAEGHPLLGADLTRLLDVTGRGVVELMRHQSVALCGT